MCILFEDYFIDLIKIWFKIWLLIWCFFVLAGATHNLQLITLSEPGPLSLACFALPSALPRSSSSVQVFLLVVADPISNGNRRAANVSHLLCLCVFLPMSSHGCYCLSWPKIIKLSTITAIITISNDLAITFSAYSVLLKMIKLVCKMLSLTKQTLLSNLLFWINITRVQALSGKMI